MHFLNEENKESVRLDQTPEAVPGEEVASDSLAIGPNSTTADSSVSKSAVEVAGSGIKDNQVLNSSFDGTSTIAYPEKDTIKQSLEKMAAGCAHLEIEFSILQEHFDSKIRYDQSKETMIDALHKELQAYRDGLHYRHIRPISMGLIDLLDDLESILSFQTNQMEESSEVKRMRQNLEVTCDSIKTILEENGVVGFSEAGDMFDRKRQRVQRTEPTDNPELAGKVCKRLHMGFEYDNTVMRPEVVSTWKYLPKQETL